ncbi:HAMP domain-containing histidine kinase [candidate division KSB1 bacterium]|nr:HAMP domain-containing histidine kinase [candidate division KSB1 bacterium]
MKLLTQINLQFLAFSVAVMLALGIGVFYAVTYVVNEETAEKLENSALLVQQQIEQGASYPSFPPFIEVSEITEQPQATVFADTSLRSISEEEMEDYRTLTLVRNIRNTTYKITIRESKLEAESLIQNIFLFVGLSLFGLVVCLSFLNFFINRSVWKPFYNNLRQIQDFSLQSLKPVALQASRITEFSVLNEAITALIGRVLADYQVLVNFTENAAHELQTPLSIMRVKLESLLNISTMTREQSEIVQSLFASVNRLAKLNSSLVLLTKVENQQFQGTEVIQIKHAFESKLLEFQELIDLKKLTVKCEFTTDFAFEMNSQLCDILLTNLFSNAINHNFAGGALNIKTDKNIFSMCNTIESPLVNPDKIFDRFYKENPASKSSGLGLAIVKKICDSHQIEIHQECVENTLCFTLHFLL